VEEEEVVVEAEAEVVVEAAVAVVPSIALQLALDALAIVTKETTKFGQPLINTLV
jgi:hypothetical protein